MNLSIKPLDPAFKKPRYATSGSAGFDFQALADGSAEPGEIVQIPLGFACAFPPGFALLLMARSGHGKKYGACAAQGVGLVDSDYRDPVSFLITVKKLMTWKKGDRICQGTIVHAPRVKFDTVDELPKTARMGGFGSSGT